MKAKLSLIKRKASNSKVSDSANQSSSLPISDASHFNNNSCSQCRFEEDISRPSSNLKAGEYQPHIPLVSQRQGENREFTTMKAVPVIKWACTACNNECVPIVRESRCLCGHRMKEHKAPPAAGATNDRHEDDDIKLSCTARNCRCKHFFFLVAEGSWILRCRCKHKHTDHDCVTPPFVCNKCNTGTTRGICNGFNSPWVCNCGHPWATHKQYTMILSNESALDKEAAAVLLPAGAAGVGGAGDGGASSKKQFYLRQDGIPPSL